eukprot:c16905_g1_i2 orf=217-699(+)
MVLTYTRDAMNCLSTRPSLGLGSQVRATFSPPSSRSKSCTRPWTASFFHALFLDAKMQRPHSVVTARCVPLRREQIHVNEDSSGNLIVEIIKSIFRDLQSGVMFLFEQPKELRYLEFPSLQSAGKMAIFTIAVVMVLIIFLATVDSGLSYIVASVFRRVK